VAVHARRRSPARRRQPCPAGQACVHAMMSSATRSSGLVASLPHAGLTAVPLQHPGPNTLASDIRQHLRHTAKADLRTGSQVVRSAADRASSAFRANSAPAGPTESIMLRDRRHGGDVLAADGHSLTGVLHAHGLGCLRDPESRAALGSPSRKSVAVDHRSVPRGGRDHKLAAITRAPLKHLPAGAVRA
jgi:hypothetical protein